MQSNLANKQIILAVTGSIAAYKSPEIVRRLREAGALVRVVMTEHAKKFLTPLTMQAVSGLPVHIDLFDLEAEAAMGHIELARWADLILIAPATADCMARIAMGRADDLLTTLILATRAPIMIAPAMNQGMWSHSQTQTNQQTLLARGIQFIGPASGSQACGDVGFGRMSEPDEIFSVVQNHFAPHLLSGVRVLITAGSTQEAIDPVRFISNRSSGKMGFAIAEMAKAAGAEVTLIAGPHTATLPAHVRVEQVTTANDMHAAVMTHIHACDIFISVAAVSDYRAENIAREKIKKQDNTLTLTLIKNPDILKDVSALKNKPKYIVGFAAETEHVEENAALKLKLKNIDMIVANRVSEYEGMMSDENEVTVITKTKKIKLLLASKKHIAKQLIELIAEGLYEHDRQCNARETTG